MIETEGKPFSELLKIALPVPVKMLGLITTALTKEYGPNVVWSQSGEFLIFRKLEKPANRHLRNPPNRENDNGQKSD